MSKGYDAIVLLGYALEDGQPTDELRARVRAAARAYDEGLAGIILASGGAAQGCQTTEAEAMLRLLMQMGIPEKDILLESKAKDTMENLRFAAQLLGGAKGKRILVVTSDYHVRRSVWTARRVGFKAAGYAAELPHDELWQRKKRQELAYTVDLLMGWQDEGRSRPAWTYMLFEKAFGRKKE